MQHAADCSMLFLFSVCHLVTIKKYSANLLDKFKIVYIFKISSCKVCDCRSLCVLYMFVNSVE